MIIRDGYNCLEAQAGEDTACLGIVASLRVLNRRENAGWKHKAVDDTSSTWAWQGLGTAPRKLPHTTCLAQRRSLSIITDL
ncbi:hypothetical protein KC347_g38 [Hortaea werneckii]|nr:hypothetical protein KC347_g38 [Hortaea werneckii]